MSDNVKEVVDTKPKYEISNAKDQINALTKQTQETSNVEDKKEVIANQNNDSETSAEKKEAITEKKRKPRAQKRIETLASEKRELQRQVDELTAKKDGKESESNTNEDLDPANFEDYDEYLDALDEKEKADSSKKEDKADSKKQKVDVDFQKVLDDIEIKFDDTRDKYEDFDTLIKKPVDEGGPAISQIMLEAINEFDNAGEVAYALAKDVTNSIRIANLKPMKQILEINKLSAKLSEEAEKADTTKPIKKTTNAPEPINALGGNSAPRNTLADAESYKDYQTIRNQQKAGTNGW